MNTAKQLRIYCDTDTLLPNLRHQDPKTVSELKALNELLALRTAGKITMLRSLANLRELTATKNDKARERLLSEYEKLEPIPKDEKVVGFHTNHDPYGGHR